MRRFGGSGRRKRRRSSKGGSNGQWDGSDNFMNLRDVNDSWEGSVHYGPEYVRNMAKRRKFNESQIKGNIQPPPWVQGPLPPTGTMFAKQGPPIPSLTGRFMHHYLPKYLDYKDGTQWLPGRVPKKWRKSAYLPPATEMPNSHYGVEREDWDPFSIYGTNTVDRYKRDQLEKAWNARYSGATPFIPAAPPGAPPNLLPGGLRRPGGFQMPVLRPVPRRPGLGPAPGPLPGWQPRGPPGPPGPPGWRPRGPPSGQPPGQPPGDFDFLDAMRRAANDMPPGPGDYKRRAEPGGEQIPPPPPYEGDDEDIPPPPPDDGGDEDIPPPPPDDGPHVGPADAPSDIAKDDPEAAALLDDLNQRFGLRTSPIDLGPKKLINIGPDDKNVIWISPAVADALVDPGVFNGESNQITFEGLDRDVAAALEDDFKRVRDERDRKGYQAHLRETKMIEDAAAARAAEKVRQVQQRAADQIAVARREAKAKRDKNKAAERKLVKQREAEEEKRYWAQVKEDQKAQRDQEREGKAQRAAVQYDLDIERAEGSPDNFADVEQKAREARAARDAQRQADAEADAAGPGLFDFAGRTARGALRSVSDFWRPRTAAPAGPPPGPPPLPPPAVVIRPPRARRDPHAELLREAKQIQDAKVPSGNISGKGPGHLGVADQRGVGQGFSKAFVSRSQPTRAPKLAFPLRHMAPGQRSYDLSDPPIRSGLESSHARDLDYRRTQDGGFGGPGYIPRGPVPFNNPVLAGVTPGFERFKPRQAPKSILKKTVRFSG